LGVFLTFNQQVFTNIFSLNNSSYCENLDL